MGLIEQPPQPFERITIFLVDCEGGPYAGTMTEFGAVLFDAPPFATSFYGVVGGQPLQVTMQEFEEWVLEHAQGRRPVFLSDNVAYDWQHINWAFWTTIGRNPFGHSARRIGDIYSGLRRNLRATNDWKRLRKTPHDHNPVNDARGNAEAFWEIVKMLDDIC